MSFKFVMFLGLILASGTIVSLTFGGAWLGTEEMAIQDSFTVFKQANILNIWSVPVPNVTFFITGARSLMMMDFAFFNEGPLSLVQWVLLMTLGLALMWVMFTVVIGVVGNLFSRVFG